jgi:hypothetical protein
VDGFGTTGGHVKADEEKLIGEAENEEGLLVLVSGGQTDGRETYSVVVVVPQNAGDVLGYGFVTC